LRGTARGSDKASSESAVSIVVPFLFDEQKSLPMAANCPLGA
jgi:hypothetical protein